MRLEKPRWGLTAILLGTALLWGCERSPPADAPSAPDNAPAQDQATAPADVPAPDAAPPPDTATPAEPNPADPAQPSPNAPPPTDPSPAPKPTAANEPMLDAMQLATPSAKMTVAADLRYQFDSAPLADQPATLHLAAVARVPGQNLRISLKETPGLQFAAGPVGIQKVNSSSIYRQQFSITRGSDGPRNLRVLVTMESPAGSGFGFFTIPLESGIR
jgi:hypothetical protein